MGGEWCLALVSLLLSHSLTVFRLRDGRVVSHEPILVVHEKSECEYGFNGGEETVFVEEGRATWEVAGGSAWRWRRGRVWAPVAQSGANQLI
jgi:hypothetical protein